MTQRDVLRFIRHAPDRFLHPWRRHRAHARLRRTDHLDRLLFVCHGNICRSPFAERYCRSILAEAGITGIRVESAGFIRPDRPSPPAAVEAARDWSVDLGEHTSRLLTPRDLEEPDTIVVVSEPAQRRRILRNASLPPFRVHVLGDLDPESVEGRRIDDPVMQPVEEFRRVYRRITLCVDELVDALLSTDDSVPIRAETPQAPRVGGLLGGALRGPDAS